MDPNTPILLNLPLQFVNAILDALADKPFRQVADTIGNIRAQAQRQIEQAEKDKLSKPPEAPVPEPAKD